MEENESRPPLAGLIVLFIGAGLIVVGVAFLTYGLYALLRTGVWPAYPFSTMLAEIGIPPPQLGWAGGQGAIDWLLAQSACVVLLTLGGVVTALGAWVIARHNRRLRLAAAAAEAATA
jgi:hypothetical protein